MNTVKLFFQSISVSEGGFVWTQRTSLHPPLRSTIAGLIILSHSCVQTQVDLHTPSVQQLESVSSTNYKL